MDLDPDPTRRIHKFYKDQLKLVKLPAGLWSKSYGVICGDHPHNGLQNGDGDTEKEGWERESPSWVEEEVPLLVEHREPYDDQGQLCESIKHVGDHCKEKSSNV